jgi:hypothetical protein
MKRVGAREPNGPVKAIAMRNVTENRAMPRGRKPEGEQALSNAERQARYRARHLAQPAPVATRPRRPADRRSRPQRWRDAVNELLTIQATYGSRLCPTVCMPARSPRCSKPLSSSTSLVCWRLNCHAATAAISTPMKRKMPVSDRIRERRRNNPDATLDQGCGVMTSPKPAHETIPNWPPSNWNGGRDQIGIGGRLRWNPQTAG